MRHRTAQVMLERPILSSYSESSIGELIDVSDFCSLMEKNWTSMSSGGCTLENIKPSPHPLHIINIPLYMIETSTIPRNEILFSGDKQ